MTNSNSANTRRSRGPSPTKTAETRKALLDAGLDLFLKNGFASTKMSDVARAAGVAKGTIYLYFTDKEALFAEAIRTLLLEANIGSRVPRPMPNEPTHSFLLRVVPPILQNLQASGRMRVVQLVFSEGTRFPEVGRIYRQTAIAPVLRLVQILARRAERRGELMTDGLSRMPLLMPMPVLVSILWNNLYGDREPLDETEVFRSFVDLLFATS